MTAFLMYNENNQVEYVEILNTIIYKFINRCLIDDYYQIDAMQNN